MSLVTQKLVVGGIYRHVRNPMISGGGAILLGEVLFFNSITLFYWWLIFVVLNIVYIPSLKEPGLERRFGASVCYITGMCLVGFRVGELGSVKIVDLYLPLEDEGVIRKRPFCS